MLYVRVPAQVPFRQAVSHNTTHSAGHNKLLCGGNEDPLFDLPLQGCMSVSVEHWSKRSGYLSCDDEIVEIQMRIMLRAHDV